MPLADVNETYTDLVTTVFSSTIAAKAWLATAALALAVVQVTDRCADLRAAELPSRPGRRRSRACTAGRAGSPSSCTLPVFFHCVTILGLQTPDARVAVHSLVGTFVYGVFVAKVLVVRDRTPPGMGASDGGRDARLDAGRSCG